MYTTNNVHQSASTTEEAATTMGTSMAVFHGYRHCGEMSEDSQEQGEAAAPEGGLETNAARPIS